MRPRLGSALALLATTCTPQLGPGDSLVTSKRILAIRADPAEAIPGTSVTFASLIAGPGAPVDDAGVQWNFCTAPAPLTQDNVVSDACLGASALVPAGVGATVTATTPAAGCSIFGPGTPSAGFRPRDPDATGGYYQPLRADLAGADSTFALARIRCDLANAGTAAASAFAAAYQGNENPRLLPLVATLEGSAVALTAVPAGARLVLQASWPAGSAEIFAYFDPVSQTVTHRRESMQVAWYSTGGALDSESTGRASTDPATTTDVGWQAPAAPGLVRLWTVLRDSRGGVAFATYDLVVK
jgi:hypothetical protein